MKRGFARAVLATLIVAGAAFPYAARAQDVADLVSHTAFRVCADPHNLPFSNDKDEGFENKVADLIAADLHLPLQDTFFPDSQGFVRATLMQDRCDVVMGAAVGSGEMDTTEPYYHTGYMIVTRTEDHITATRIDDPAFAGKKFGLIGQTPPTDLIVQNNLMDSTKIYPLMVDTRIDQPAHTMLLDLVAKKIDAGLVWGPIAGYYIKHDHLPLTAVFMDAATSRVRLDYHIAMGVRGTDTEFRRTLNREIGKNKAAITQILKDYGVPLLDEQGHPLP